MYRVSEEIGSKLPLYYHTTRYGRFYDGELPVFCKKSSKPRMPRCPPHLEQPGLQVGRHVTLAVRGQGSLCARFHNIPIQLPPIPRFGSDVGVGHEHS